MVSAFGPDMRTMETLPCPNATAVATAAMVAPAAGHSLIISPQVPYILPFYDWLRSLTLEFGIVMRPFWKSISQLVRHAIFYIGRQEGSAGERARGLGIGIFCGCLPFFGFQIILSIAAASLLRGNHLLATAGTFISNPFTYVPLYWFNYRVGEVLAGSSSSLDFKAFSRDALWEMGWTFSSRLLIGSGVVAAIASISLSLVVYVLLRRYNTTG